MIPVTKTYLPPLKDFQAYLDRIWESGWLTNNGQYERELTKQLGDYLSLPFLEVVANGTLALQIAIKALDLHGEIITTPFTYVASSTVIVWEGCTPVFVDIEDDTFCINPDLIEEKITEKTSAILATHVYGIPCKVKKIAAIAKKHNLKVIYDAAHCFGGRLENRSIMDYGDISTMSFHATKIFHTVEGGAVSCRDEKTKERIYLMKKFGHIGEEDYIDIGINAKMSELHAAMGLCVLPVVDEIITRRKELSNLYDSLLDGSGLQRLVMPSGLDFNYAYYPVFFPTAEMMALAREELMKQEIYPRRYFYPSLNMLPYLQGAGYNPCPISESAVARVLSLPLYYELKDDDVEKITEIILKVVK